MAKVELYIVNNGKIYVPIVTGEITWELERTGTAGTLKFTVLKDSTLNFEEGNLVQMKIDGTALFYGFVFEKQAKDDNQISVKAYDQLRYLKNKDTKVYENLTANELITQLANDFNLQVGTLEDTKFKIASAVEDNEELFTMIVNALDKTLVATKELYILYDDFGKITLKNINNMKVPILIDATTAQTFDYTSSIDSNTYNQIKLVRENKDNGTRDVYISKDTENINKWGTLQYFATLQDGENGEAKAEAYKSLYNSKTKSLSIKGAFGDVRVRAGSLIMVKMDLGDMKLNNFMLVEKCTHKVEDELYTMDLTLKGGEINA